MKQLITWHDSFSVNNVVIDNQHKKLIDIINRFYDTVMSNKDRAVISEIFEELKNYTNYHFKAEESMLEKVNYLYLQDHKVQHQGFVDKLNDLEQKFMLKKLTVNFEMMGFLRTWLVEHIMNEDKRYMKFLNNE